MLEIAGLEVGTLCGKRMSEFVCWSRAKKEMSGSV